MDRMVTELRQARHSAPRATLGAQKPTDMLIPPVGTRLSAPTILALQRTIGNHATIERLIAAPGGVVQRAFAGDLKGMTIEEVVGKLQTLYPGQKNKVTKIKVSGYLYTSEEHDSASLAKALGLGVTETPTVTPTVEEVTGTEKAFDKEKLRPEITKLYTQNKSPQKADFLKVFRGLYHKDHILTIVQSPEFVYGFQDLVRAQVPNEGNKKFLVDTEITDVGPNTTAKEASTYKMADISKWKLRHYSDKGTDTEPPPFTSIESAVAIPFLPPRPKTEKAAETVETSEEKSKKSGHTGDRDWNRYGNTGSTFFLLCVDGQIYGKQEFLKNANWYVEFDFDQPSIWLSSDWLDEKDIKGPVLRGKGRDVQLQLLQRVGNVAGKFFEESLVAMFHNLEVKIPGPLRFSKADWKQK